MRQQFSCTLPKYVQDGLLRCATKGFQALAQDQKAALERLIQACPGLTDIKVCSEFTSCIMVCLTTSQVATYDGDTPQQERKGTSA